MAKVAATGITAFTLDGTSIVAKFDTADLTIEVSTEEAADVNAVWSSPSIVGKSWSLSGSGSIDTTAFFTGKADTDPTLTVVFTTGAKSYSGTGILTSAAHGVRRFGNQTESWQIVGVGALTVADPS